jgi:hypothetical protein
VYFDAFDFIRFRLIQNRETAPWALFMRHVTQTTLGPGNPQLMLDCLMHR